jgi:hypothetical protein
MRHTTTGVLLTKVEVFARMEKRYAAIVALLSEADSSHNAAIQRTLDALDHPHSHYVVLSTIEREQVRTRWSSLAKQIGARIVKHRRKPRSAPTLPPEVLAFFGDGACIPHFPQATDDCEMGMRSMPWTRAQTLRYIGLNPPEQLYWLLFDCDHDNPMRWKVAGLPEPSFVTICQKTNRHHVAYKLKAPVCRSEYGRSRPLVFLRAVQEGLRLALEADPYYVRLLTKNPLHPCWKTVRRTEMPCYSLAELAATVDLPSARVARASTVKERSLVNLTEVGVGSRNRALFDVVRQWARQNHDNLTDILAYAERCNAQLAQPLGANEVRGIARSIERYMTGQRRVSDDGRAFRLRQAERGRLGGRPKTTPTTQPWAAAAISRSTWYRRQRAEKMEQLLPLRKIGRPSTTKDHQPWLAAGISRATWYRQRKVAATAASAGSNETKYIGL